MMPNPWCECRTTKGYASLLDPFNTFVCCQCNRPSYMVYEKSHKLCEECAVSFFSKWELVCPECNLQLLNLAYELQDAGELESSMEIIVTVSDPWMGWKEYCDVATRRTQSRKAGPTSP